MFIQWEVDEGMRRTMLENEKSNSCFEQTKISVSRIKQENYLVGCED